MIMWRYFQIGKGKKWNYTNVTFHSSVQIVKPYSSTCKSYTALSDSKKKRVDRSVNTLNLCTQIGRAESIYDTDLLADHMLSENLTFQSVAKSMIDRARHSYVDKMNLNSSLNSSDYLLLSYSIIKQGIENFTNITGWALPKRKVFRYSSKQKTLLMQMFMAVEERGKKMSPEQVHQQLRTMLKPSEYVTTQQIRSLFCRWSKQKRTERLVTTFCEEVNLTDDVVDETDDVRDAPENEEDDLNDNIQLIAKELAADFQTGDWIVVPYFMQWYPAIIQNVRS
ncbi:uncharacterized protein LOC136075369 isoform X2 [Hydra vulgaris]|uniref:uncharacterized protein LOC136075369 isoform X2 n=1 Tax=Hydra vulgaris TaxID=6087 RepID=UPI0032E9DABB